MTGQAGRGLALWPCAPTGFVGCLSACSKSFNRPQKHRSVKWKAEVNWKSIGEKGKVSCVSERPPRQAEVSPGVRVTPLLGLLLPSLHPRGSGGRDGHNTWSRLSSPKSRELEHSGLSQRKFLRWVNFIKDLQCSDKNKMCRHTCMNYKNNGDSMCEPDILGFVIKTNIKQNRNN